MQSRSNLFLVIVLVLTGLAAWGYSQFKYKFGIDVQGGTRLVYQIGQTDESKDKKRTLEQDRLGAITTLLSRAEGSLAVNEPTIQAKGLDQIVVELPGFTNAEQAKELMGSTARLLAFHAKNITTERRTKIYSKASETTINGVPVVNFRRTVGDGKEIGPGDPEYAKIIEQWGKPILEGNDLADARPQTLGLDKTVPEFTFSAEGTKKMEDWTRSVFNQGEQLAFVIDGKVLSIAPIKDGTILHGDAFIDGSFEPQAVAKLTRLLREGALEVKMELLSEQTIDASIGAGALGQMVNAGLISFGIICVFLVAYYARPGLIAVLAMVLYGLFTLTSLKGIGATFSLASIAAFILSVGMAVDANILVFERIKEELRSGRPLASAVDLGFKRALSAIIDSNACTLLTSLVLYTLGTGPVKGFAITLIWGVLISFFTAFTVTRAFMFTAIKTGFLNDPKFFAMKRNWFGEKYENGVETKTLHILARTKTWFAISIILIVIGGVFVAAGGIKPNVEFGGGYEGAYRVGNDQTMTSIRERLVENGFEKANVKTGTAIDKTTKQTVRIAYITIPPTDKISKENELAKQQIAQAAGVVADETSSFSSVGPTIQKETVTNAYLGIIVSSGLIILYIAMRFGVALGGMKNGIKFGISAIIALLHDALFVIGVAGIVGMTLGWEISALFITAMLTVIGFSVHDTIIIFDRIRENLRRPVKGETFEHLIDKSVTQTIARSVNTSMTAFVPLVILVFFGTTVPELKFMCLTMAAGIAVGTYSSIFNASPILWLWNKATIKRQGEQADLMMEAQRELRLRAQITIASDDRSGSKDAPTQYGQVKRKDRGEQKIDED